MPELEKYSEIVANKLIYRVDNITPQDICTKHIETHKKNNVVKDILNDIERIIYLQKPDKNNPGALTDYGRYLKSVYGDLFFRKAVQLIDNNLSDTTGFRAMTDASLKSSPIGSFVSTFNDPDKVYITEKETYKDNLGSNDIIYCKEAQLKLIKDLVNDDKLTAYKSFDLQSVERYITRQNEVLINPDKINSSFELYCNKKVTVPNSQSPNLI